MLADETEAEMLGNNLDESDTDNLGEVLLREVNSFIDGNLIGVLVEVVVAVVVDDGDEIVDIMILSCNEMTATMNVNLIMDKIKKRREIKNRKLEIQGIF